MIFIIGRPLAHYLIKGIGKMVGVGKTKFSCYLGDGHIFLSQKPDGVLHLTG